MKKNAQVLNDVDKYIENFPAEVQEKLESLRTIIRDVTPGAEEAISYQMPRYKYHGPLVYFAGYKNHIGFYPTPSAIEAFKKELSVYKGAKGSVQFPLDKPLPTELIKKIVRYKMKENEAKSKPGSKKKKTK